MSFTITPKDLKSRLDKGDKLVLVHPRENYPLEIRLPDRYACGLGQIRFSRSRGKLTGFTVTTGRVVGLKFVRDDRKGG